MENTLDFIDRLSMSEAKKVLGVDSIALKKNPHTGKLFAVNSVGKQIEGLVVSTKFNVDAADVCISEVEGTNGRFYLLHEQKEGGLPALRTF